MKNIQTNRGLAAPRLSSLWRVAAGAVCAAFPAAAQENIGSHSQPLTSEERVEYWTARNNTVPVCWMTPGFPREKDIVRAAVANTWSWWANIDFTGWGDCPANGSEEFVRVRVSAQGPEDSGAGGVAHLGTYALGTAENGRIGMDLSFEAGKAVQRRVEYIGVHEFGHVLGFAHEQDAPGNEGPEKCNDGVDGGVKPVPITGYDRDSIMNYCNRDGNMTGLLTDIDIAGVQQIYGVRRKNTPPDNKCVSLPAKGLTSLAAVWNQDGAATFTVFPTTGSRFKYHEHRKIRDGGWHDSVKWMAGDFNGDGATDIAAAWNNGGKATLTVRLQQPDKSYSHVHWLVNSGGWSDTSFYMPGDFNGDGKTDLAGVWNNGGRASIAVFLSDGAKFLPGVDWNNASGGWHESIKWFPGDFNADGKTDIGAAWNNAGRTTLTVRLSDGVRFSHAHWLADAGRWFNSASFVAADYTGDGRADVAQLWNDVGWNTITVFRSYGSAFASGVDWAKRDGGQPPLKWIPGDFNGDGRADIAAAWNNNGTNTLTVRASNGSAFVPTHWSTNNGGWMDSTAWCASLEPAANRSVGAAIGQPPLSSSLAQAKMTGTFDTSFGLMVLTASGGTYDFKNGRLWISKIDGDVMEGVWEQDQADRQCPDGRYRGRFRFVFSGTGFTGKFGYCDAEPETPGWNGTRR